MDNAGYSFGYIEFEADYASAEDAIAHNAQLVQGVGVCSKRKMRAEPLKEQADIE